MFRFVAATAGLAVALSLATPARAELLQIIHTNDLHSHLESSPDPRYGGYAAVKGEMDAIRASARDQGIESLQLDGGDFSDGAPLYLAEGGQFSWKVMNTMGYDAIALGNHDYLVGMASLDAIVKAVKPDFALLAANFVPRKTEPNLQHYLKPYVELRRGGLRIAIIGVGNSEFSYRWLVPAEVIPPMVESVNRYLPMLRARNDLVIALTHIGTPKDRILIAKTRGIDLVVGAHTHEFLQEPVYQKDLDGNDVPIVQAGAHGKVVGDLLVEAAPGRRMKILRYQLQPVYSDGPADPQVAATVHEARQTFEAEYGAQWLHDPIGNTTVDLAGPVGHDNHSGTNLALHAMKDAVGADLALDSKEFYGTEIPPGPISREQLFGFYPRIFGFQNPRGWTVWTLKVQGWALSWLMNTAGSGGDVAHTLGIDYDLKTVGGKAVVTNIKVNGEKIKAFRTYTIAMPEGFARWVQDGTWMIRHLMIRGLKDSHISVWEALEHRVQAQGTITQPIQP